MDDIDSAPPVDAFASAWLRGVPSSVMGKLRKLSSRVSLGDKHVVYAQGVEQTCLWGVVSGEVRVHVALAELEPTLGHIHHPGAWLGESEPILGVPGIVEMRAAGQTVVERVAYPRFRALAIAHPELWEALARLTSMNQLLAMRAANDLALRTGRKRLAAAILRLSGHRAVLQGSMTTTVLQVSQQEIAGLANLARSRVSEHLKDMEKETLIQLGYGSISIVDVERLQSVIAE